MCFRVRLKIRNKILGELIIIFYKFLNDVCMYIIIFSKKKLWKKLYNTITSDRLINFGKMLYTPESLSLIFDEGPWPNFLYYIHNYFNFLRFFCFIILKSYCTYLILQPLTKFVYVYIFSAFIISQNIEIADFDWVMTAPLKANLPLFVNHWRVNTYFSLPLSRWPVRAIADIKRARV